MRRFSKRRPAFSFWAWHHEESCHARGFFRDITPRSGSGKVRAVRSPRGHAIQFVIGAGEFVDEPDTERHEYDDEYYRGDVYAVVVPAFRRLWRVFLRYLARNCFIP